MPENSQPGIDIDNLHFVIKVLHQSGHPIYLLIMMDLMNRLHIRQTPTLPPIKGGASRHEQLTTSRVGPGVPVLDMTHFRKVELLQVVDETPKLKEDGSHLLGKLYSTELRVWDIIRQRKSSINLDAVHESHLLFDIDYQHDTVNLISLYNHTHRDEVIGLIVKDQDTAKIILCDFHLETIDLTRHSGEKSFYHFLKNLREGFVHFAEGYFPEGFVKQTDRQLDRLLQGIEFDLPKNVPIHNSYQARKLLKELYSLKVILAASLLDRTDPASDAYQQALEYFERYAKVQDREKHTVKPKRRVIRMGRQNRSGHPAAAPSSPLVVFGLPQLEDLFDDEPARPMRAFSRPKSRSVRQTKTVLPKQHDRAPKIGAPIKIARADLSAPRRQSHHLRINVGRPVESAVWDQIVIKPGDED